MPVALTPVFLITHEFFPKRGGIATFTEEIARASAGMGYDLEVWAQSAPPAEEKQWPFRLRRLPLRGSHDFICQARLAWQLIKERRRLRYATVYLPEPGPILAMMLLQFVPGFRPHRLILTFHGSEIVRFARNPLTRWHARKLISHASRISTLSRYTQDLLLRHFPEATGKTCLTPGALRADLAVVSPVGRPLACPATPGEARADAGRKVVVLTVGRLHPRKGQLETLRSLAALAPEFRARIEYWLVGGGGKGGYESALRREAALADFPVRFFGAVPDAELKDIYSRADIFAMTSITHGPSVEGFGLVYLEASANGLPVVAHAIGGVHEAVLDGETGFLVPPHRPAQLTAAFEKLITDPALRARLGHAGRDWATRNCWSRAVETLFSDSPA